MIEPHALITRSRDIQFQVYDDELLAVDADSGYCYSLNESAGRIWALLEAHTSLGSICRQLCQEYVVEESVCMQEVSAVLLELSQAGLVVIEDGTSH